MDSGLELTVESLILEITVSADHDDQTVTRKTSPLQAAIDEARRRFDDIRAHADAAA